MKTRSISALVEALVELTPGTRQAEEPQHAIEGILMKVLRHEGGEAAGRLVESLASRGYVVDRLAASPWMWRVAVPPPRVLEIWFTGINEPVLAALSYRVGKPWGSRSQRSAAERQAAFYERYGQLDPRGDALGADDRLILLVGELEADVHNGGFGQYLGNKGEARAREALACLTRIRARRTARWLAEVLEAGTGDLAPLDRAFTEQGEDLASLVMAHLNRKT